MHTLMHGHPCTQYPCTQTAMHSDSHAHRQPCTQTAMHTDSHAQTAMHTDTHAHTGPCTHAYRHMHTDTLMHTHSCTHTCAYRHCMHTHTHTHTYTRKKSASLNEEIETVVYFIIIASHMQVMQVQLHYSSLLNLLYRVHQLTIIYICHVYVR